MLKHANRWSHPPDNQVVPSPWQATDGELETAKAKAMPSGRSQKRRSDAINSSRLPSRSQATNRSRWRMP